MMGRVVEIVLVFFYYDGQGREYCPDCFLLLWWAGSLRLSLFSSTLMGRVVRIVLVFFYYDGRGR